MIVDDIPVDVIVVSAKVKSLEAELDMGHSFVTGTVDRTEVQLGFEYERPRESATMPDHTDSEDFSFRIGEEEGETSSEEEDDRVEYLVGLAGKVTREEPVVEVQYKSEEELVLSNKLDHLPKMVKDVLMRSIVGSDVAECSIHYMNQADVPVQHTLELDATAPTCHTLRRLPPRKMKL